MTNIIIKPKLISKENFKKFGDMITTADIKPIEINNGYAKRYDGIANLNTKKDNGESTISIFSALKIDPSGGHFINVMSVCQASILLGFSAVLSRIVISGYPSMVP